MPERTGPLAYSPSERVRLSRQWLAEHEDGPLRDRAAHAVVIAADGRYDAHPTYGAVAEIIGESASDVLQGLLSIHEQVEMRRVAREVPDGR